MMIFFDFVSLSIDDLVVGTRFNISAKVINNFLNSDYHPSVDLADLCKYFSILDLKSNASISEHITCLHVNTRSFGASFGSLFDLC